MFIAKDPHRHLGQVIDTGHCVRFVQVAAGVPHTSRWRPGIRVRGATVAPGTVIATFRAGRYTNDVTGDSHAAIYLGQTAEGLQVLDQWVGQPVAERLIRFRGGSGKQVNDGDAFWTVTDATRPGIAAAA